MVEALVDTVVLVDVLRGFPLAIEWLGKQPRPLGITPVSWLEIIEGSKNASAQNHAVQLLRRFVRVDLVPADYTWAISMALQVRLSHGVDAFDCLIEAPCQRLGIPLYTRNLKHFVPLLGQLAQPPY